MKMTFFSRTDPSTVRGQPVFDIRPRRYSWDVYGGPKECEAVAEFPAGYDFLTLWSLVEFLRCGVEVYDDRGATVWWGFVDKITVNDGKRSFGIALDNMFNKVAAAYELLVAGGTTGTRMNTAWYEDTISSGIYGHKEKWYSMTSYSNAAAAADVQARLEAAKYPVSIAELASSGGSAPTVEFLCSGWWKILSWIYYDNATTTYSTVKAQLVTMAETSEFVEDADCSAAATTLAPNYRQGDELLSDEIKKLMEVGDDNGNRILATVDRYRQVHFYSQPAKVPTNYPAGQYVLATDNRLYNVWGGMIPASACTIGRWANLRGYEQINGYDPITAPSPIFIERATYDCETGEYQPESYGYKSPFDELQGIQR